MPQEIVYTPTCANCPLGEHLGRNRVKCAAAHNTHNPVRHINDEADVACEEAIEQYHQDQSWLNEPINDANAVFGGSLQPEEGKQERSVRSVRLVEQTEWQTVERVEKYGSRSVTFRDKYRKELWEVINDKGKAYSIHATRNDFSGLRLRCNCPAGQHYRKCYHIKAVQQADKDRVVEENRQMVDNRGAIAQPDGTVKIDERFYQLMGDVRNNRGGRSRF